MVFGIHQTSYWVKVGIAVRRLKLRISFYHNGCSAYDFCTHTHIYIYVYKISSTRQHVHNYKYVTCVHIYFQLKSYQKWISIKKTIKCYAFMKFIITNIHVCTNKTAPYNTLENIILRFGELSKEKKEKIIYKSIFVHVG